MRAFGHCPDIQDGKARAKDEAEVRRPDPDWIATPLRGKCGAVTKLCDLIYTLAETVAGVFVLLRSTLVSALHERGSNNALHT